MFNFFIQFFYLKGCTLSITVEMTCGPTKSKYNIGNGQEKSKVDPNEGGLIDALSSLSTKPSHDSSPNDDERAKNANQLMSGLLPKNAKHANEPVERGQ